MRGQRIAYMALCRSLRGYLPYSVGFQEVAVQGCLGRSGCVEMETRECGALKTSQNRNDDLFFAVPAWRRSRLRFHNVGEWP